MADGPDKPAQASPRPIAVATLTPSPQLAEIVGTSPLTRNEAVARLWDYIKARELQDRNDKRQIVADGALARVFGKPRASMFEIDRYLVDHLR